MGEKVVKNQLDVCLLWLLVGHHIRALIAMFVGESISWPFWPNTGLVHSEGRYRGHA